MISYITGTLEYQSGNSIVVECGGIGYSMMISGQFMNRLPAMHSHIKVFTYMSVREDEDFMTEMNLKCSRYCSV